MVLNNPENFVLIASDGRIMQAGKILNDNHKKLTALTPRVSMFSSGAQDYCEDLREQVSKQIHNLSTINEISNIVCVLSNEIHNRFISSYPDYYKQVPDGAVLATLLAFYDEEADKCGYVQFCHTDNFEPHIVTASEATLRGLGQERGLSHLLGNFNPQKAIESVLDTFDFVGQDEDRVGGEITVHIVTKENITIFERGDRV